jgi:succinoglycan biosynthesis protein ExoA
VTAGSSPDPLVTIIMPVRNERRHIRAAVMSALAQDLQDPFEVVVADGMSDDGTRELLDSLAKEQPRLHIVDNPGCTTPHGLNRALAAVRGRYFVRLDGHSSAPAEYARLLVDLLKHGECEAAGGIVRAVGTTPFGRAVAAVHGSRFALGNAKHHYLRRREFVDHVAHGAYLTELARTIGGFDEHFTRNQDYEFDYRYGLAGGRILLEPAAVFEWKIRETPAALARQYFQYGYWKFRALRRHSSSLNVRWLIPPAFVVSLVAGLLSAMTTPGRLLLVASLGSYSVVIAIGAVLTSAPIGRRFAPLTALALITIHLSWGSGFLLSAADTAIRSIARLPQRSAAAVRAKS